MNRTGEKLRCGPAPAPTVLIVDELTVVNAALGFFVVLVMVNTSAAGPSFRGWMAG